MDTYTFAQSLAKEAGKLILTKYYEEVAVHIKKNDPKDFVTDVDLEINNFLISRIKETFPEHNIYSEEGGGKEDDSSSPLWILDPIDGTSNFSRHIPHFSVTIGLIEDGVVTVGVVYNPITNEMFHFKKGNGAFFRDTKIEVSSRSDLSKSFVLMRAGRKEKFRKWGSEMYYKLLGSSNKTSNLGSSALDICFIAAGRVEAVIYGTLNVRDIGAAVGLLKEAGGLIFDGNGNEIVVAEASNEPMLVLCANNESIKKQILGIL